MSRFSSTTVAVGTTSAPTSNDVAELTDSLTCVRPCTNLSPPTSTVWPDAVVMVALR